MCQYPAGTHVLAEIPVSTGPVIPMGTTRLTVRTWRGVVLGPVAFEPGMLRVRPDGQAHAVRVLTGYLRPEPAAAGDFPCCATPAPGPVDVSRWIAPGTLDRFPLGPYAVHAYFPATRREVTLRNQLPESAASSAGDFAARGCDVHISLDTCG